jgi:transcriptional regulator with XRE-family HTH domain
VSSPAYDVAIRALVDARKAAGLSQAALATKLGKPPSYVAKIELKERRVDVVEFIEFLRAVGADEAAALQAIRTALARG